MVRKIRLQLESLEERRIPAVFGIPWTDPRHLTVSFAPDQTSITGAKSTLFQTLNAQQPTVVWQRDIMRALQTWTSVTNLDVGATADSGAAFGSRTPVSPLPQFGDLRVGALAMTPTSLAIGVPPDPFFADSWSGEVIYNSANNLSSSQTDLYSVFLHEFGHALGLPNSSDPDSVMYPLATAPRTGLAPSDIVAIRNLYGPVRGHDLNDQKSNNGTIATATRIRYSDGSGGDPTFAGEHPLVAFGDITTSSDVDVFELRNLDNYGGPLTFRLQSTGISLVAPKLTVLDENGQLLGESLSTNPAGDTISVHLSQVIPGARYYLRVTSAVSGLFGIGRFAVAVTFDPLVSPESASRLEAVMRGRFDTLDEHDLRQLFVDPENCALNEDADTDNDFLTAVRLDNTSGFALNSRYNTIGSLPTTADIDVYRVRTPQQTQPVVLTITTRAGAENGGSPLVELFDANQLPIAATILANGDGRFTIQATNLQANADYFVRLRAPAASQTGNYDLTILATSIASSTTAMVSGPTSTGAPARQTLIVTQNQVFHFLLSATGSAGSVIMDIRGSLGSIYQLTAPVGSTVSGKPVLLRPGTYTVYFWGRGTPAVPNPALRYSLRGIVLSDPIGPILGDPTLNPSGPRDKLTDLIGQKLRDGYSWVKSLV